MADTLESPSNDRIKRLVRLRGRKHRDAEGVFLVEGERELRHALDGGFVPTELYHGGNHGGLAASNHFVCSRAALAKASYRDDPEAIIAVFEQFETDLAKLSGEPDGLYLVAEGLEKPGNLGAILRTCDGVGATALLVVDSRVDLFNPNVVRASTGALFTVPVARATLLAASAWLRESGVVIYAATPEATTPPWELDLSVGVALAVGAEDRGLSPAMRAVADHTVAIEMRGAVDSLNCSVTMAMLAYEAMRQRSR